MKNEAMMIQIFVPIIWIILSTTPFSTSALTTFGKSQTQNHPVASPTPVGNARNCKTASDCNAIQNTTCMSDLPNRGERAQCLCGDYTAPVNGRCNNKGKSTLVPCNDDSECHEGAECVEKKTRAPGKKCYCKEGFLEDNYKCNGAEKTVRFNTVALMIVALLIVKNVGYST